MSECQHGSLERQCATCELEGEIERLVALAFLSGASMERISEVIGWDDPADVEAAIRRVCVLGGQG